MAEGGLATAAQWRQNCASVSGCFGGSPSKVRVRLAPEWLGDASRPDSGAQNGLGLVADRGKTCGVGSVWLINSCGRSSYL
jgi:hypothetical protein